MTVTSKRHKQKYRDRELNIVIDAIIDAIKCKETSFFSFFQTAAVLTSHIWAAHAVSLSAVEQKAVLVGSARTKSWSTGLELHLRVTPR